MPTSGSCGVLEVDTDVLDLEELLDAGSTPFSAESRRLGAEETFDLVIFSSYEITERAPYLGEMWLCLGEPTWKPLDRHSVEVLIGQPLR